MLYIMINGKSEDGKPEEMNTYIKKARQVHDFLSKLREVTTKLSGELKEHSDKLKIISVEQDRVISRHYEIKETKERLESWIKKYEGFFDRDMSRIMRDFDEYIEKTDEALKQFEKLDAVFQGDVTKMISQYDELQEGIRELSERFTNLEEGEIKRFDKLYNDLEKYTKKYIGTLLNSVHEHSIDLRLLAEKQEKNSKAAAKNRNLLEQQGQDIHKQLRSQKREHEKLLEYTNKELETVKSALKETNQSVESSAEAVKGVKEQIAYLEEGILIAPIIGEEVFNKKIADLLEMQADKAVELEDVKAELRQEIKDELLHELKIATEKESPFAQKAQGK